LNSPMHSNENIESEKEEEGEINEENVGSVRSSNVSLLKLY